MPPNTGHRRTNKPPPPPAHSPAPRPARGTAGRCQTPRGTAQRLDQAAPPSKTDRESAGPTPGWSPSPAPPPPPKGCPGHTDPPLRWVRGRGGAGTGSPDRRSKGPKQETLRGMDHLDRQYKPPARGTREVRAQKRRGRGARTSRVRGRKNTQQTSGAHQKGNWMELKECTDNVDGGTRRPREGTPGQGNLPRGARGRDGQAGERQTRNGDGPAFDDLP